MYPQHMTLTEYEIVAFKNSMENTLDIRAIGIVAKALKAGVSTHIFMIHMLYMWYLIAMQNRKCFTPKNIFPKISGIPIDTKKC